MTVKGWRDPAFPYSLILDNTSLMPVGGKTTRGGVSDFTRKCQIVKFIRMTMHPKERGLIAGRFCAGTNTTINLFIPCNVIAFKFSQCSIGTFLTLGTTRRYELTPNYHYQPQRLFQGT
jgi:hypothetical protein